MVVGVRLHRLVVEIERIDVLEFHAAGLPYPGEGRARCLDSGPRRGQMPQMSLWPLESARDAAEVENAFEGRIIRHPDHMVSGSETASGLGCHVRQDR